ncbi:MAG: TRM11 family SAM-dependent methyltransferase [Bacteroidota bacterium]
MRNKLNDLSGREWLFWTNTVYETAFPPDATYRLRKAHGAMKPPELMAEIIRFFTREGELVLDPFAGVGGTLLGAALAKRESLGFELNPRWVEIYHHVQKEFTVCDGRLVQRTEAPKGGEISGRMAVGDCLELMAALRPGSIDAIVTDPPYGWMHGATGFKEETNFAMLNVGADKDFGNAVDLEAYLALMARFGQEARRLLPEGRYLVMLVGDRFRDGEYVPLGFLVANILRGVGFQFKGLRLWWNKATQRPLKPYAVGSAFVPNITHQNILIMRK